MPSVAGPGLADAMTPAPSISGQLSSSMMFAFHRGFSGTVLSP
jgi:hypothetical protein